MGGRALFPARQPKDDSRLRSRFHPPVEWCLTSRNDEKNAAKGPLRWRTAAAFCATSVLRLVRRWWGCRRGQDGQPELIRRRDHEIAKALGDAVFQAGRGQFVDRVVHGVRVLLVKDNLKRAAESLGFG